MANDQNLHNELTRRDLLKSGLYGSFAAGSALGLWLSGCSEQKKANMPNIIVLTVDTLRADHIGLYGYLRDTMPAIGEFAKTAVVFDNAVIPRGSTRPGYSSMLTGLYPFRHGVYNNTAILHKDLTTLPQLLKSAGYHTACFVSNFSLVKELSGCHWGFDIYDDRVEDRELNRFNYERKAPDTVKAILEWIQMRPQQPFFLFTNFIDPHGPYHPPERFRRIYHSQKKRMLNRRQIPPYQLVDGSLDFYDYLDRYDAEISYTDEVLGMLIAELKSKGLWDDALIVFTADHGEHLGVHADIVRQWYLNHLPGVWEATAHVPLMIRLPRNSYRRSVGARRVRGVCSPMDLAPTILDYIGIEPGIKMDGQSLLPILKGSEKSERVLLLESPLKSYSYIPKGRENCPDMYAMRSDTHKLVRSLQRGTDTVLQQVIFDVSTDPLEIKPLLYDDREPLHRRLAEEMDVMLEQVRSYRLPFTVTHYRMPELERPGFVEKRKISSQENVKYLSEEQIKRLRSLGYVE